MMQFCQNGLLGCELKLSKSKTNNKMLKRSTKISEKSSLKTIDTLQNPHQSHPTSNLTVNSLINKKYYKPAIKQYQRSDANTITRCIKKDFQYQQQSQIIKLYEFVVFYSVKQYLKKYNDRFYEEMVQKGNYLDYISNSDSKNNKYKSCERLINRNIFHFYDKIFDLLKTRMNKLKNIESHKNSLLKISTKQSKQSSNKQINIKKQKINNKKLSKSKSKQKNMKNVLKGLSLLKQNKKIQTVSRQNNTREMMKIKRTNQIKQTRKIPILSKDTEDMNTLVNDLSILLDKYAIESIYAESLYGIDFTSPSSNQNFNLPIQSQFKFNRQISPRTSIQMFSEFNEKSKIKQKKQKISKFNQFTQIIQNQQSIISAIKSSEIANPHNDQYQFYGLSQIKQKKQQKKKSKINKNSNKNNKQHSNCQLNLQQENSTHQQSRITNKKISTQLKLSNFFIQQTPKKLINSLNIHPNHANQLLKSNNKNNFVDGENKVLNEGQKHNPQKSRSKTLKKRNLNEKSKSKSLSSTQKSLKKDPQSFALLKTNNLIQIKSPPKILQTFKSTNKEINQKLIFMQPLNLKQQRQKQRKNNFLLIDKRTNRQNQRKDSKSKSKGKITIMKK